MSDRPPHEPGRVGPVAEGQLQINKELAQRSPEASREALQQQQDALQRERPEVVHEAAARRRNDQEAEAAGRSPVADAEAAPGDPQREAG